MKSCCKPTCKKINPQKLTEFTNDKTTKDGLYPQCKHCRSEYTKSQTCRNKDKARYPRRCESLKKQLNENYLKDPEKYKFRAKEYRDKYPERHIKHSSNWQNENPSKHTFYKLSKTNRIPS